MSDRLEQGNILFVIFFSLSWVESLFVGIWILQIPADPKHALMGGYSVQRLMILGAVFSVSILSFLLAFYSWRSQIFTSVSSRLRGTPRVSIALFILLVICTLACLILLWIPPPSILSFGSAVYIRLAPLLLLVVLIGFQGLLVLTIISPHAIRVGAQRAFEKIGYWIAQPLSGYLLLALSILIAATQVFYVRDNIGDEGDAITVGWLLSNGWVLYKDIFSHHFPFPYVWVAFIIKLFGALIFPVRFSIVIFRILVFTIAMKLSRYYFAWGLTALAWSVLGHFYLGNSLIYFSFSGVFILGAFSISFAIVNHDIQPRPREFAAIGILLGLAILTDPLATYPAIITLAFVFLSMWLNRALPGGRRGASIGVGLVAGSLMICILLFLICSLTFVNLSGFYTDGIVFNQQIYSKYLPLDTPYNFVHASGTLLELFSPQWHSNIDPHIALEQMDEINDWIFTGLLFRLSILLGCILLIARGRLLSGLFMYLFAAALLVRSSVYFYTLPFVLFSMFVISLFLSELFIHRTFTPDWKETLDPNAISNKFVRAFFRIGWLVVFSMFIWLNVRGVGYLLNNKERMSYEANFGALQEDAIYFNEITCHQPDARILVYPLNPILYFLSGIPPASRYHFLTPWVAEIGQDQVIADLKMKPAVVLLSREENIWGYPVKVYLNKLLDYLDKNYIGVGRNYFISPQLGQSCEQGLKD